ncbi:Fc.00g062570.m01.CDS01 [Cosmosporella sp. VM-42]
MAPTLSSVVDLAKRDWGCRYGYYYRDGSCQRYGNWYYWGRWVLAAILVVLFLIVLLSCLCISRRRRRRGVKPMYGTGWIGGKFNGPPQNNHQMYNYGGQNPPPAYGQQQPQYTGTTFNPNDGYYGNQQTNVQPPIGTYQRDDVYAPPSGPPPGK